MSPQPASNVEQRAAGFSDGDDGRRKVAGGAYSSKDFAISAREVPPDPDAAQSEHTTHNEPAATPSKRVKSHIAPWMTQRHKNAIRRSLGPATASETPVELSPSQTGAAPKGGAPEGSARDSNLSQDTQP
ncbi:hypothetical protein [Sporisorium scitamineum]|nr:hypothetical protein [Sporisorium scitamineum]